jgi:1,4-alpha-glucan branching enzyme
LRIIILTWEFPPRIIGDIAPYVNRLAVELVKKAFDVYVVTFHDSWTGFHQGIDGVKAYRVTNPVKTHINIVTWDLTLTTELERAASDIYYSVKGDIDLIDANEWSCVVAATVLKKSFNIPFIYTIHSLEDHRSHGANFPLNIAIKSLEWLGCYESNRILVKTDWMKKEVERIYNVPLEKIDVVNPYSPNWIAEIIKVYENAVQSPFRDFWRFVEGKQT